MYDTKKMPKIGIVTPPRGEAATTPLSNLVNILSRLSSELHVLTGGTVQILPRNYRESINVFKLNYKVYSNMMAKVINHVSMQLRFSYMIIKLARKVYVWFFFLEGHTLLLPLLTAKLMRKKAVFVFAASIVMGAEVHKGILAKAPVFLEDIGLKFANKIILYSENLVQEWGLGKYEHKIVVAHEHFIDFTRFVVKKKINERTDVLGYMGRFSEEKGILNLIESISIVLKHKKDLHFTLCGGGELSDEISSIMRHEGLDAHIKLTGWVSHKEIPDLLNDLKLMVLPSYTEGLPNVVLEAMACGTPVLATAVGGVPEIIKDGENGFLLKSNDPKHIAERIVEILGKPELLEKISGNACKYVRENFSYEKTLGAWQKIFEQFRITN